MLTAVKLDDESVIGADKIGDEVAERHLAAKFQAQQAAIAQLRPQTLFDIGLICAQAARGCGGHAPA